METLLRKEIEPQWDVAEKRYPEVLHLIMDYTVFCDENGDEDNVEYQNLERKLHRLTGKDMSRCNLWEWWEEDGAEPLAFRIALPDPVKVEGLTKDELTEIVRRIKTFEHDMIDDETFKGQFFYYLNNYYSNFLALNTQAYDPKLFLRQKDKTGNYFEYSIEEIVEKLWCA